jgi:hypothetical protein
MPRPIKELTDMEIDEISLVDRPANAHAKVVITKRDEEAEVPEDVFNENGEVIDASSLTEGDVVFDDGGQAFVVVSDEFETDDVEVGKSDEDEPDEEEEDELALDDEEADLLEELTGKSLEDITAEDLDAIEVDETVEKDWKGAALKGVSDTVTDVVGRARNFLSGTKKAAGEHKVATAAGVGTAGVAAGVGAAKAANVGTRTITGSAKNIMGAGAGSRFKTGLGTGSAGQAKALAGGKAGDVGHHIGTHKTAYGVGGAAAGATGLGGAGYLANERNKVSKSFSEELREELSKSLTDIERDEVIAKAMGQVEEMASSLAEAEEIAKSERDLRLSREYEEVAKSYNLPVEPSELAPVLMAIGEHLPFEYGEVIHKALSAAGEILFEEIGVQGAGDNNDVLRTVDAFIEENVSKADISKAAAVTAVFADNPDAYDEYMATRYGS